MASLAVRDDVAHKRYVSESMKRSLLSKEDELSLATRWRDSGDEKALHQLVSAYARLVIAMASKFKHYGLSQADLVQEGNIGLMLAAQRFEPARDLRFSTYATWWVRAQMQDYVLRNWSIVRTGSTAAQKSLFFNLRRLRAKIEERNGRNGLSDEERGDIARLMGVSVKDINEMEMRMGGGDQSLNAPVGEAGEDEVMSFLADDRPNPEDIVIGMRDSKTRSQWLATALQQLSERERDIIKRRHLSDAGITLEDLGHMHGISKERVRQLEARAMDKLRDLMLTQADARDMVR